MLLFVEVTGVTALTLVQECVRCPAELHVKQSFLETMGADKDLSKGAFPFLLFLTLPTDAPGIVSALTKLIVLPDTIGLVLFFFLFDPLQAFPD